MNVAIFFQRTALWGAAVALVPWTIFSPGTASAGSVSYTYDSFGQLTKATYTNGAVTTYTYDAAGNRTKVTTTAGAAALSVAASPTASITAAPGTGSALMTSQTLADQARQLSASPLQLPATGEISAILGWNESSDNPTRTVSAIFENDGTDRLLHLQGYEIDTPDSVGLWLNNTLLGYLSMSADGNLSTPSLWLLPATLQVPGKNTITLAPRTENQIWGVTRLGFYSVGSGLGNQAGLAGGDLSHTDGFELHLFNQKPIQAGYQIELAGWDVNSKEEIALELNNVPLPGMPQTNPRAWSAAFPLFITPDLLQAGDNQLMFSNRQGTLEPWGVRINSILVDDDTP